jgi:hypothetical protein
VAHDAVSTSEGWPARLTLPSKITIVVADQLYIDRTGLPPAMTARLIRLAAFQNPEFYFPTFGKPRIISCAERRVSLATARARAQLVPGR